MSAIFIQSRRCWQTVRVLVRLPRSTVFHQHHIMCCVSHAHLVYSTCHRVLRQIQCILLLSKTNQIKYQSRQKNSTFHGYSSDTVPGPLNEQSEIRTIQPSLTAQQELVPLHYSSTIPPVRVHRCESKYANSITEHGLILILLKCALLHQQNHNRLGEIPRLMTVSLAVVFTLSAQVSSGKLPFCKSPCQCL